jgi:VWFA-related protein
MRRPAAVVLAVLAAGPALLSNAQEPPREAQPVFRVGTELVQVDAVVTDKDGRYVTDLRAEDFEIVEDGQTRPISNFRYVALLPAAPGAVPRPPGGPEGPPPTLPRAPGAAATMAIVVDDLSLSFESTSRIRRLLYGVVDDRLAAGELLAVLHTGGGMANLQQFTSDPRLLRAAIDGLPFNLAGRGMTEPIGKRNDVISDSRGEGMPSASRTGPDAAARQRELEEYVSGVMRERQVGVSLSALTALERVVEGLERLPGRKSLLFLSEGLVSVDSRDDKRRVEDRFREITDAANRAGVVIYTIDPGGLRTLRPQASDLSSQNHDPAAAQGLNRELQRLLETLAEDTGGLSLHDTNDLAGAVRRVVADRQGYYLLGYQPDASRFLERDQKARFHQIRVKVKRPGLQVRSRRAYFARPEGDAARPAAPKLTDALLSPLVAADLPLRLTPLWSRDEKRGPVVRCLLHMDARSMTFQDEADGGSRVELEAMAVLFGARGGKGVQNGGKYTLRFRPEAAEMARREGLVLTLDLLATPGPYQVRAAVRDLSSGVIGSAAQFLELPDLKKDRPALSSIVMSGAEAGTPAIRQFRGGAAVAYAFIVYNPRLDASKQASIAVDMNFYHDGVRLQTLPAGSDTTSQSPDGAVSMGGTLRLGDDMKPGIYALAVVAEDRNRRGKDRYAIQWADFEVVGN